MGNDQGSFVGRKDELSSFRRLLKNPKGKKRVALILGGGGIGKTLLVKKMLAQAQEMGVLASKEPIDLFSTDYRHIDGIQGKIIEIIENLSGLRDKQSPFAGYKKEKADTSEIFYDCLKEFCVTHPLVLAFDTFENLDKVASDWLFRVERGGLQVRGLICIVAGREEGREKEEIEAYRKNPLVMEIPISGFTLKETEDFYRRIEMEFKNPLGDDFLKSLGIEPSHSVHVGIERIWKITQGHPLKLEMAFRWPGTLLYENSLVELAADKYDEELMRYVREWGEQGEFIVSSLPVRQPVFDTLTCMAYITRRFDTQFLQFLIDEKIIRFDDGVSKEEVLDYLRQYFFVKTRGKGEGGLDIVQLHDEMARLVREYVWSSRDQSGERRQEIFRAVIRFYDVLIAKASRELSDTLQVEQLYYILQLDRDGAGMQRWFELAELGNENIKKLLPGEIKRYVKEYDIETQVRIHSKLAEIERNANHISQALGHWEEVRKLGEAGKRDDWVVDALIGKFNCVWMDDPELALDRYLLPARRISEKRLRKRLARVYYEIGFANNQMQDLKKAMHWYQKGLRQFQQHPENSSLEATLFNDAGYAYLQYGRWGYSIKYLNEALKLRLERYHEDDHQLKMTGDEDSAKLRAAYTKSALFAGLSHNTLGEFHRYAGDLDKSLNNYDKAYNLFEDVGNYFWQAKCLCARGETHRRLARQAWQEEGKNSNYESRYDQARQDFGTSLYLCAKYQLDDERDTAYRRLGRLSHDLAMIDYEGQHLDLARQRLKEAYDCFGRGLEFARRTRDVLEELENLTELAFLADDAIVIFGRGKVPEYYQGAVKDFEEALWEHKNDPKRIYIYPVFEALLKMEKAAIAFADEAYDRALGGYVEAFSELAMFSGYGHTRYRQHFEHLTSRVVQLPREKQLEWKERFVEVWTKTEMPGQKGRKLTDDLLPDLVKWFNRSVKL